MKRSMVVAALAAALVGTGAIAAGAFGAFGAWSTAVDIESSDPGAHPDFNTASVEGCPFVSPDGTMFFMASNRAGGAGGLDIWVSTRDHTDDEWGAPVNLGAPINSIHNDFCPTIGRDGKSFFFVSNRPGYCGAGDIFTARFGDDLTVESVEHLGCDVNSAFDEHSPFPTNMPGLGPVLFYSSARPLDGADAPGDHDLYMSTSHGGVYQAGAAIAGVNTTSQDGQPNVRRDGLELFFYSDRPGSAGNDIYSASRSSVFDDWGTPVNLGAAVNSAGAESRPSLSWDGTTLYFGSTRAGSSDVYMTTR